MVWKIAYKLSQTDVFPAIKILLSNLKTLPVSSATAKRSFRALRPTKSDRYTKNYRLNFLGQSMKFIHNDMSISTDAVLKTFSATTRKMKL